MVPSIPSPTLSYPRGAAITLPSTHFERGPFLSDEEEEKKNEKEKNSGGAITLPSTHFERGHFLSNEEEEKKNEKEKV